MKKNGKLFMILVTWFVWEFSYSQTVNMHLWATGENHNKPVKTVPLLDNYAIQQNGDEVFTRYGSDARIKTIPTGFYFTKKINGRWWIIDPEGYAGINMAVTSLPDMTEQKANWAYSVLRNNGYNGTGNFFAKEDMTKRLYNEKYFEKMSYTRRRNFFQSYRTERQKFYLTPDAVKNNPQNYITIFDPEFETHADNLASGFANFKNERDLLGYFSDNEINFTEDQLKLFLTVLPESDPNYQAAINYLNSKSLDINWVIANYDNIPEIRNEFLELILERYFSVVTNAIKKYDPNHLYLGTRLHGKPRDSETAVTVSSKYCDIVSVNYYNYVFPRDQICNPDKWGKWLQKYDKPCLITEFYAKEYSDEYPEQPGAGFYTDNQSGRGIFYQSTCLDVLRSKYYVGWHYFRWQDDPPPKFSNKGMVNMSDQEYVDMTYYMEELNKQVYHLIDYFDERIYNSNDIEVPIPVSEDSYIQLSGTDQGIPQGDNTQLSISTASSASGLRQILLKFDLGNYYDSLSHVVDANIRLHYLSGDSNQVVSICGIKDNSWKEETITGTIAWSSPELLSNYGKGRIKKFIIKQANTPVRFNVRNWLLGEEVKSSEVSFRISLETSGPVTSYWASREHENSQIHPVLFLTLKKKEANSTIERALKDKINIYMRHNLLHIDGLNESGVCEIFSINGQKLKTFALDTDSSTPISLVNGIYIIRLRTKTMLITKKIQIF